MDVRNSAPAYPEQAILDMREIGSVKIFPDTNETVRSLVSP